MPATMIPPQQAAEQARLVRVAGRLLRDLARACDDLLSFRARASSAKEQGDTLAQQHPEYAGADVRRVALWWAMLLAPLAICVVDVFLLSGVSEYLALLMFPDRPNLVLAARLFVAIAVVIVEILIAGVLQAASQEAEETENSAKLWIGWIVALGWAAFLAGCLVATQQAAGAEEQLSTRILMYSLAGFCFLLHCLLPLGHQPLHEAKGYLVYRTRMSRHNRERGHAQHSEAAARRRATVLFQQYAPAVNRAGIAAGPFSRSVREVVNEIFGDGTIPPPVPAPGGNGAGPTPQIPPPQPPPAANDEADGEAEYLRTILERRLHEEDSEVRA